MRLPYVKGEHRYRMKNYRDLWGANPLKVGLEQAGTRDTFISR